MIVNRYHLSPSTKPTLRVLGKLVLRLKLWWKAKIAIWGVASPRVVALEPPWNFAGKASKNDGFPMKNGGFPMKNGGFPMNNGGFPMKNGGFSSRESVR